MVPRGTLWRYHRTHRSFGSVKSGHSEGCSCIIGTHVRCALGSGAMKRSRRRAFLNAPLPVRLFANGARTTTTRDGGAPIRQRRSAADADTGSASSARACSTPSTHGPHLHEGFACPIDIPLVKHPTANTTASSAGDRAHEPCGVSPSTAMRCTSELKSAAIALITVQDQADRAALALEDGFLSQSSKQSRYGKIKTLCDIAAAPGNSLFPLELSVIRQVAGVMLKAGYRSVDSYLAAARTHNSELGYILPESLKHWMKGADRATRRGQGRALRAVVFDPVTAAAHCPTSSEQHTIRYGPELAWHSLVVGVWWMLREVELIELRLRSVKLHEVERRVEIRWASQRLTSEGRVVSELSIAPAALH